MASQSTSGGSSASQSTSTSFIPNFPQTPFLMGLAGQLENYANQGYARYDSTFQPLENQSIAQAQRDLNPTYIQGMGARAAAGAQQTFEQSRQNALRELGGFGVADPSNVGRRYAIDRQIAGQGAAAAVGASNEAMDTTRQRGIQEQQYNIGIGQQNANRALEQQKTAMSLKYSPLGQQSQSTSGSSQSSQSSTSNPSSGSGGGGNQGGGGGGDGSGGPGGTSQAPGTGGLVIPNKYFNPNATAPDNPNGVSYADQVDQNGDPWQVGSNQMTGPNDVAITDYGSSDANYNQGFNFDQNSYDGGGGDGYSAGDTSFDPSEGMALGGGVPPVGALQLQPGGPAPVSASPSHGAKTDDIDAKLDAHEFVIPQDVAIFKGHEHFYKLMQSAREARLAYKSGRNPKAKKAK